MNAQALVVESTKKTEDNRKKRTARDLTLDMIRDDGKSAPVAKYIFPFIVRSGINNTDLSHMIGYAAHSNLSMVRAGTARLPTSKVPALASAIECDAFKLGTLVAENNYPEDYKALKEVGVIISAKERELLDLIEQKVPKGEMRNFKEKFAQWLDEQY